MLRTSGNDQPIFSYDLLVFCSLRKSVFLAE